MRHRLRRDGVEANPLYVHTDGAPRTRAKRWARRETPRGARPRAAAASASPAAAPAEKTAPVGLVVTVVAVGYCYDYDCLRLLLPIPLHRFVDVRTGVASRSSRDARAWRVEYYFTYD